MDHETRFHDLIAALAQPTSARWKLRAFRDFLEAIEPGSASAEAYLLELTPSLGRLADSADFEGLDPEIAVHVLRRLSLLVSVSPSLRDFAEEAVLALRRLAAERYACVGDFDQVYGFLYPGDDSVPPWWDSATRMASPAESMGELAKEASRRGHDSADWLASTLRLRVIAPPGRIAVPVVEEGLADMPGEKFVGGMRDVFVHLMSEVDGSDDVRAHVTIDGAADGFDGAIRAGRLLLESVDSRAAHVHFGGYIAVGESRIRHEGRSAGLAVALLFASAALARLGRRDTIEAASRIAMTGGVTSDADVLPVDSESLSVKVRAAFFSWNRVLAVPAPQLRDAMALVDGLALRYPARHLELVGVRNVRDAVSDRRLVRHRRMSLPAFAGKQLSKHRAWVGTALAGVVIVVLVLAALAERRDLNPVGAHLEGKTVVLENADGRAVYRFPSLGDSLGSGRADFGRLYRDIALADIDGDGFNEACFGVRFARGGHLLRCVRIPSGKRLWEDLVLRFDIDYPRDPSVSGNLFFVRCIDVWDYDGDGRAELLLALSHDQQHPAIVIRMDPMSRAVLNRYDHSGAFVAMERTDLNGDGRQEVLLGGTNNSYNVPVVAVLDPISMAGTGPAAGDWSHGHPRPGHELAYIRFEPSTLSRAGYVRMRSVVAGAAAIDIGPDKIVVRTFEGQVQQIDGGPFLQAVVLRYFDHRLRPIRGTTDDLYRHTVASLVERGLVPHRSYASELDSLRDAVRYWTGTEWTDSVFTRLTYPEDDA